MIYLDNAATSFPKPESVYVAVERTLRESCGNAGRGVHAMAAATTQTIREVRARLARFIGAEDPSRVVFTFNATDALNIAIKGYVTPGCHVVTSQIEHNSVLRPLKALEKSGVIEVTYVGLGQDGIVAPSDIAAAIKQATHLVVLTHASNVLGTIQPVSEVGQLCRERGIAFLVDGAQSVGEVPVDVSEMYMDMLAFPGHKSLLGPQGTGGLYIREGIDLRCWREGGTGTESASDQQPGDYPTHLEAGTSNLPGIAGLGEGIKYIEERGMEDIHRQGMEFLRSILGFLESDSRFTVYGSTDMDRHVHVLSFNIQDKDPSEVGLILDQSFGIAVRTGLHCAAPIHRIMGTHPSGMVRVSPGPMTTEDDIRAFVDALKQIADS
jgi:cysteine desulfurase family protein